MNRISIFLKFGVFLALNAISTVAYAETKLTKPVGGGILPFGQVHDTDIKSSFVFSKLIPFVIKYLIGLSAALAVIAIMFGGYQFLTAYGDAEQHKKATKTITWAVIGLILAITAYAIVALVASIQFTTTPTP